MRNGYAIYGSGTKDRPLLGLLASFGVLILVALVAVALSFLLSVMILIFGGIGW